MKYPDFLKENGTIGFVAPSFGCATEPYKTAFINAQKKFRELGYNLNLGPNCYADKGIGISNTPKACGKELTDYYCSVDNDILISCGGGELMCETVGYTDFDKIKAANPKWYMGFSDNTNMTFLMNTLCDTASIYGPCASNFGMEPWHESITDTYRLLQGKERTVHGYDLWEREQFKDEQRPLVPYNVTEKLEMHSFLTEKTEATNSKEAVLTNQEAETKQQMSETNEAIHMEGRLLGGCMDCLVNLLGTEFDHVAEFTEKYKEDGILWFLESCDLNVMSIRRAIWQMQHAGWFKYVKGFLIGRPAVYGEEMMGLNQYQAVTGLLAKYHVPVIMDVDLGHLPPMMPIISGSYGKVDVKGNDITIEHVLK